VISLAGPRGLRFLGAVTKADENDIELYIQRIVHKDKRDYPRVSASIDLRYHVLNDDDSPIIHTAWQKGIQDVSHALKWHAPNSFVNFSRSGLQFTDQQNCTNGDRLMFELQLPNSSLMHRLVGQVVRVEKLTEDSATKSFDALQTRRAGDTHSFAVQFDNVPNTVEEALSRATVEQQMKEIEWKQIERAKAGSK